MPDAPRLACIAAIAMAAVVAEPLTPGVAQARGLTLVKKNGKKVGGSYQRWADRSRIPTVRGRVRVLLTGCPARPRLAGCVYSSRLRTIYLVRGAPRMRRVLYHELGHLFDFRLMGRGERRAYKRLIGQRGRGWFAGKNPPAEQFAEAYALCARTRRIARAARGHYAFRTSPRRHAAVCALIRRAAGPAERPRPPRRPPVILGPPPPANPPAEPKSPPAEQEDESLLDQLIPG